MKRARIAVIALCMLLLVLPSAAMPLLGARQSEAEYRVLKDFPALVDPDGALDGEFDAHFEEWLCDHFALRTAAVRANAWLHYRLLRSSANEQVVVGKGDWLYFSPTVPDYTGEGRLTRDELDGIADNLRAFTEDYVRRGARVYLAIVPNKNSVYPQYMPDRYPMREDAGNLPLVREACADLPLTWVDLASPLAEAALGERPVYYRTDTHYNALGAAIAARAILAAAGKDGCGYEVAEDISFTEGELARLMGLHGALAEPAPRIVPDRALPEADYGQRAFTMPGGGEGRLTVFRDSFGTAAGPWLTDAYGSCEMIWSYPMQAGHAADDVLILICERNIRDYLLTPVDLEYDAASEIEFVRDAAPRDRADSIEMEEDDDFFGDDFFDGEDEGDPSEDWDDDAGEAGDDFFEAPADEAEGGMRRARDGI